MSKKTGLTSHEQKPSQYWYADFLSLHVKIWVKSEMVPDQQQLFLSRLGHAALLLVAAAVALLLQLPRSQRRLERR